METYLLACQSVADPGFDRHSLSLKSMAVWVERKVERSASKKRKRCWRNGTRDKDRPKEREMVRCAARRGVVFGFVVVESTDGKEGQSPKDQGADEATMEASRRKCEAVMLGKVVEPSFAKGDWSIRWRE